MAEADVYAVGTALQYAALIINGDGTNPNAAHPFLKVQSQNALGSFSHAACYLGNNGSAGSFGLGFFTLTQPFSSAHMRASRTGSTVTIGFTNVNGGALPNQTYDCTGAPAPVGSKTGIAGFADNTSEIDNFSNGAAVLENFSFVGALAGSGRWFDAVAGLHANGNRGLGGNVALSFFIGGPRCAITLNKASYVNGDPVTLTVWQWANLSAAPLPIELKLWVTLPDGRTISTARAGADGSLVLPAGFNANVGPRTYFTVSAALPRGNCLYSCRFLSPVTGGVITEGTAPFSIP